MAGKRGNPIIRIKTEFTKTENLDRYPHVRDRDITSARLRQIYGEDSKVISDSTFYFIVPEEVYEKAKAIREEERRHNSEDRMCPVCKIVKPASEFYPSEFGGYLKQCKLCYNKRRKRLERRNE